MTGSRRFITGATGVLGTLHPDVLRADWPDATICALARDRSATNASEWRRANPQVTLVEGRVGAPGSWSDTGPLRAIPFAKCTGA